ncbi:hypothetical protein AAFF_G00035380 [Aldrovandia affinis]|uniref:Uncharacterized protein n=1 Tax=Aldrovandia affinis TaxID=143900 RepID=A0AAD7WFG6_9TELE|nr:hypothetical protein AAFF_G00035380 [Aldrovandia affinis]
MKINCDMDPIKEVRLQRDRSIILGAQDVVLELRGKGHLPQVASIRGAHNYRERALEWANMAKLKLLDYREQDSHDSPASVCHTVTAPPTPHGHHHAMVYFRKSFLCFVFILPLL